jgi:hypothetical protein
MINDDEPLDLAVTSMSTPAFIEVDEAIVWTWLRKLLR